MRNDPLVHRQMYVVHGWVGSATPPSVAPVEYAVTVLSTIDACAPIGTAWLSIRQSVAAAHDEVHQSRLHSKLINYSANDLRSASHIAAFAARRKHVRRDLKPAVVEDM